MKHILCLLYSIIMFQPIYAQEPDTLYGIINKTDRSITFAVDENLPAPRSEYHWRTVSGDNAAKYLLMEYNAAKTDSGYIASSFKDCSFKTIGKDVLFQCIVRAYAEHRPLVLSPDMIWLNICQVFSHYANGNKEKLRDKFVFHDDKMNLVVQTNNDLMSEDADWSGIMDDFIRQIGENTKDNIAETFVADFSTTGKVERIASGITLMDVMKAYFDYIVVYIACGIPEITLTGTPDDWKKVLDKTCSLEKYGMEKWIGRLKPVLGEFIKASEGKPNRRFWKDMVTLYHPDQLRGGVCSSERPTLLDGWFLRLFPYNKDGKRITMANNLTKMMPEMVRVPFKYIAINGDTMKETQMELWSGFVGVEEDSTTLALTPKIGWLVRNTDTDNDILQEMKKNGFSLRIKEVPSVLSKLKYIEYLKLDFIGKVSLPEWMDNIKIGTFLIRGKMSDDEKAQINKRFPNIVIMP